jgi:tellurite resistance protein
MGSPDNRSLNSSRMMKVMDNQDKLYQQRQHKIISNIEKEEKMQKQREKAQKARKKERAEFFSKKQGAFEVCK